MVLLYVILALFIIAFFGGIFLFGRFLAKTFNRKLQIAAQVLNTTVSSRLLGLEKTVRGSYRGRSVVFSLDWGRRFNTLDLYVEPRNIAKRYHVLFDDPEPTKNTSICGNCVAFPTIMSWRLRSQQDFLEVLEELTKAAEIVEQGDDYYKEAKPRSPNDWGLDNEVIVKSQVARVAITALAIAIMACLVLLPYLLF